MYYIDLTSLCSTWLCYSMLYSLLNCVAEKQGDHLIELKPGVRTGPGMREVSR